MRVWSILFNREHESFVETFWFQHRELGIVVFGKTGEAARVMSNPSTAFDIAKRSRFGVLKKQWTAVYGSVLRAGTLIRVSVKDFGFWAMEVLK